MSIFGIGWAVILGGWFVVSVVSAPIFGRVLRNRNRRGEEAQRRRFAMRALHGRARREESAADTGGIYAVAREMPESSLEKTD
jgi:hypothetical protein